MNEPLPPEDPITEPGAPPEPPAATEPHARVEPLPPEDPITEPGAPKEPPAASEPPAPLEPVTRGVPAGLLLAVGAVLFVAAAALAVAADRGGLARAEPTPSPTAVPTFSAVGNSVGFAGAPVTIEIWSDYQCPFCGLFAHGVEPALVREYAATGEGLVVSRDFAFLGQESVDAAVAARCAGRQDLFWRYHDLLFAAQSGENQGAFRREALVGLAGFAGVDTAAFTTCLDDPAVAGAVEAETEQGRKLGISSTPTVRIVGPGGEELLTGLSEPELVVAAINRRASAAPSEVPSPSAGPSSTAAP
jgi:protein-disulfide isomerase